MFGDDFFPTPETLADKMLSRVFWDGVSNVLEPSAGRGDLVELIVSKTPYRNLAIDTIEIDQELSQVLDAKGYRPIGSDFLEFQSFRRYDVVVMNPPFSNGDRHLLKAIDLVRDGGQIVCLLNAETIKNPYTKTRQDLVAQLEAADADIEYLTGAFTDAVRQTNVEIALVSVKVEKKPTSSILTNLAEAERLEGDENVTASHVVDGDYIHGAVRRFNIEVKAGLKLIDEYHALKPLLSRSFNANYDTSILELSVNGKNYGDLRNDLVDTLRMKYWRELFQSSEFSKMFTKATADRYQREVGNLGRYEFTVSNIKQLQVELSQSMLSTLDEAIVELFEAFTHQYYDEQSNNVHYYNGWKTNKAYVVNRKVIDRCYGAIDSYFGRLDAYRASESVVSDIEKVFAYLDGQVFDADALQSTLETAKSAAKTRNLEFAYCTATFFKKGTVHITFKDERLLKKFNLIGSQRKGWLPPNYGKVEYENMTEEERGVVDAVEGRDSYYDTFKDFDFYLSPRTALPVMIGEGA